MSHCTMLNPLCPSDLCVLPYGHTGADHDRHLTGTMPGSAPEPDTNYAEFFDPTFFLMAPKDTPVEELVRLGCDLAQTMWPEQEMEKHV